MRKLLFGAVLFCCSSLYAGTKLLAPTNAPHSGTLPATCSQGDIYQLTSAGTGTQWYACESANTWVQQGGSGGGNFIKNQSTLQSGANFYTEGSTVSGNGFVARSTFTNGVPLSLYFRASFTGDRLYIPLFTDVGLGSGDGIAAYLGYNTGGSQGTSGWTFNDQSKNEIAKVQTIATNGVTGFGVQPAGSGTMSVTNTIDNFGSFGVPTSSTTASLTLGATHFLMLIDATAGAVTMTFPALDSTGAGINRRWYKVCRIDNSGNAITFSATGDDTISGLDTLDNKGDCIDYIGRVGLGFGSTTAGVWQEVSKTVQGGITGNLNVTGYVHASGVIASEAGTYAYAGTTVTYAAPTIDTNDRIPTLNNGSITWPLAVTDGAQTGNYNLFIGSNVFSGGINIASATATNPTLTNTGDFSIDTSSGQVIISTSGSSGIVVLPYYIPNSIAIATPTVGDYHFFIKAKREWTVDSVVCLSSASTSTTIQLYECDANGANCTSMDSETACTTTETAVTMTDTDIAAGDRVKVMVTATSGTPGEVVVDLYALETRK